MDRSTLKRILVLVCLLSCQSTLQPVSFTGVRMTIPYQVLIGERLSQAQYAEIQACMDSVFDLVNAHFNCWNVESELSRLNQTAAYTPFSLSPELDQLLAYAAEIVSLTEGRFDPTVAPIHRLWRHALNAGTEPDPQQVAELQKATGWHHLHVNAGVCIKDSASTELDLCGIAKGYAVDLLIATLQARGYRHVHVTWGGEIRAIGRHPSQRTWNAAIASPTSHTVIESIELMDQAIATSGDYHQYWITSDKIYTHVCFPSRGCPLEVCKGSVASATVLAPTCWLADGLATALMLATSSYEAEAWMQRWKQRYPELGCRIVYRETLPP